MSLYEALMAAGIPVDNHESDLYAPDTPQVREILARYPISQSNTRRFINQVEGGQWLDIPFAFDPWWIKRQPAGAPKGGSK